MIDTGLVELENSYSYKAPASDKSSLQVESIQKYDHTTVTYGYDELGNITSMVTHEGTYEYEHENSWKDQLTSIVKSLNGVVASTETISYTGSSFIGNPSSIGDKNLTWSGRRLTKITEANKDTIEYFYNELGNRTQKKV
ncbi:MAG: hypothetical protein PQJ44_01470 [Sphaerochaetaceae bacterium]|nr:hypothetical protein [Sphaerochaetaceae bacterium]